jgi:hypothetical protein
LARYNARDGAIGILVRHAAGRRVQFETLLPDISARLIAVDSDWLLFGRAKRPNLFIKIPGTRGASGHRGGDPRRHLGQRDAPARFVSALLLDEVVLGEGNAKKLTTLPKGCRMGDNANALFGGFRLWKDAKR